MNRFMSGMLFFCSFITLSVVLWHELAHSDFHWLTDLSDVWFASVGCFAFGYIFLLLGDEID